MKHVATLIALVTYVAAGGLGFNEVACVHGDSRECVLPLEETCSACETSCPDDGAESICASPCGCGPCVDLLLSASLLTDAPAAAPDGGALVCEGPIPLVTAPAGELQLAHPTGPSPPATAPPIVTRC